ncbi:MAG: GNAT family N-acetyltransferase [Acidimicrobiia bacterium]|nr:MAG: GNAT family N-acetyltransferase [Acidimicrobiia bacterium]
MRPKPCDTHTDGYAWPMNPELPSVNGYQVVAGPPHDLGELTELVTAVESAIDGSSSMTDSYMQVMIADPDVEPIPNNVQIRSPESGALVGFGRYVNKTPHVESITLAWVDPEHEGAGIGTALTSWGLRRSRSMISMAPPGSRVTNRCEASGNNAAAAELLAHNGYAVDRHFLEMELELHDPVEIVEFPSEVSVRTMQGPQDIEVIVDPLWAAFQDHYGWTDSPRDARIARWHRFRGADEWDDSLVWIVESSGGVVAVNACLRSFGAKTDIGYVASLGVIQQWRGMGIARALLTTAFAEFHRRGKRAVALHVDADSLTGATRLYESVGMQAVQTEVAYLVELRAGTDLVVR